MTQEKEFKAVKFDHYGGLDVLHIDELPLPAPGNGEVLVKVKAAVISPPGNSPNSSVWRCANL